MTKEKIIEIFKSSEGYYKETQYIANFCFDEEYEKIATQIIQEFESEKQELIEALIDIIKPIYPDYAENYKMQIDILEKHTGKSIEEILKKA